MPERLWSCVLVYLNRAPRFVGGVADIFQGAIHAFGFSGDTEFASVPDELVGEENPFLARDDAHQVLLDLLWIGVRGEFEAARDAVHMSIDDYALSYFEPRAQNYVCGLAGDAGQCKQILHVQRNLAAEVGDDFLSRSHNGFRFVAKEA